MIINNTPQGHFLASSGIRKVDPLSPYLFFIMVEVFGKNIGKGILNGTLVGFSPSSISQPISHQQFVDDMILLGEAIVFEVKG